MYQYKCLNPISRVGLKEFSAAYKETEALESADAVLVRSADMHSLKLPETVVAVARAGAGINNIPLEEMARKGVVVFNTPGANANGVKEMVIAGMLLASRDIVGGIEWLENQEATDDIAKKAEKQKKKFAGCEIAGKKLGIIGLGAIGVKVANAAVHLGMEVYGYDPYISVDAAWSLSRSIHHINDVNDIYRDCDYITIHVPLMDATKKMIGKAEISQMKEGVVLLNFARDLLVDEEVLVQALEEGKVKKYVTDFANPIVAKAPNTLVTPHLGASTEESEDNCAVMAVVELMDYLENGNIKHSVNYPDCDAGTCMDAGRVTINHKNIPNMLSQFTKVMGDAGMNISYMTNKSKGDFAYTVLDTGTPISEETVRLLRQIEGVYGVRIVK
ncbi:MAG TPA: phosphoglycerate dehydrogenase [Candidatus Blautia merdavium]|uniref:Phosphoglycerate dehydrogenase n=1 Tax=Candidatus Blautia merdavium TaxID=2838494 RepID=A0A9D2TBK2_9FIRM|nr:phosphoglycerate dehydrogenase [Candidatus Blautia merdavium]